MGNYARVPATRDDPIACPPVIDGHVAPGFEEVSTEFRANFVDRGELGAAVAAYVAGERVVDLWGGYRDARRQDRWEEDTLVLVYSTSKGMAAIAVALAHSRGLIDYDSTVASYWPEFAQSGKAEITVRQLLSHQAGLSGLDVPLDAHKLADLDGVARALARQRPAWKPGTRQGYHALTIGWYEGELIRRVDPSHRSLGRFFAEEVAAPLGLEFYIGLPPDVAPERVASITAGSIPSLLAHVRTMPPGMMASFLRPRSYTARAFGNPRMRSPADLDKPAYRAVEIPAGGGIGQVRSIARAYADLAAGGPELGLSERTFEELTAPPRPPSGNPRDLVLWVPAAYSLGFVRPTGDFLFGRGQRSLGHPGAGGSFGFADPDAEVGFAYAPNRLGHHLRDDPREKALRDALYRCLDRAPVAVATRR
jgi:CubicO group peptidase (beta-lactamase class C family)